MLGPIRVNHRSRRRSLIVFLDSCMVMSSLQGSDLSLNEPIRPREVRG